MMIYALGPVSDVLVSKKGGQSVPLPLVDVSISQTKVGTKNLGLFFLLYELSWFVVIVRSRSEFS
jgi:hypothetical protein